MITVIFILSIAILLQLFLTVLSLYVTWKALRANFDAEDRVVTLVNNVSELLEALKQKITFNQDKITKVLEIPIAGDDPYIREVISAIKESRSELSTCVVAIDELIEDIEQ